MASFFGSGLSGRGFLILWIAVCLVGWMRLRGNGAEPGPVSATNVAHGPEGWTIRAPQRQVTFHPGNFGVSIHVSGTRWTMMEASVNDLTIQSSGKNFPVSLISARDVKVSPWVTGYSDGIRIELGGFRDGERDLGVRLTLAISMERETGELVFEALAREEIGQVKELLWPKGFVPGSADSTVVPFMQGMLLPKDWPRKVFLYDTLSFGRGLYMPWWGQQHGKSAAMFILETPEDGGCRFEHPAKGPTHIEPRWVHSLGKLNYPRRLRVVFFQKGDYVDMALRYRAQAIRNGTLVTLREKFARNPSARGLIGSPVVHTSILSHVQPESSYYKKDDPSANHQLTTFEQRGQDLKRLHGLGVKRAYVHLDGWGFRGYDNLHPDILPPSQEAGGWDGFRQLSETCEALGFLLALHDQYRDYYHDAASYSESLTVIEESGARPFLQIWWGGRQSILCSRFAPDYVARNHRQILAHGVKVKGSYLDVFAVVPGDECYSPDHPVTRAQSLAFREEAFNVIRALEGIVSSEEPADWAMRTLHLVHHAPFALDPNPGKGPAMGVPIPLHSLVYHDALVVPWTMSKGGWGIADDDSGFLHALANAGVPYVSLNPDAGEIERVRTVSALHGRLALVPLTGHQFLDKTYRRQKTTFADGTQVEVDFGSGKFVIDPPLNAAELKVLENESK